MTEESLAKAIKALLKNKYELSMSKRKIYFEDIMPIRLPRNTEIKAYDYAAKLCKNYFGW
jgi:hypothetical protein